MNPGRCHSIISELIKKHARENEKVVGICKNWLTRGFSLVLGWDIYCDGASSSGEQMHRIFPDWFCRFTNYISRLVEDLGTERLDLWCKSEDSRIVQFVKSKKVLSHCIMYPILLLSEGECKLPDKICILPSLNEGSYFPSLFHNGEPTDFNNYLMKFNMRSDEFRYALIVNMTKPSGNYFHWPDFRNQVEEDLIGIYGNFVFRVSSLLIRYFNGIMPAVSSLNELDHIMIADVQHLKESISSDIEEFRFRKALLTLLNIARIGNKYLSQTEPWNHIGESSKRTETVLNLASQLCVQLGAAFQPFTPLASAKIAKMFRIQNFSWNMIGRFDILSAGLELEPSENMFEKLYDKDFENESEWLGD